MIREQERNDMYKIIIWNSASTNFNQSEFVKTNGTSVFQARTRNEALRVMGSLIHNPSITKSILESPEGCLTWVRQLPNESCDCDECSDSIYDEESDDYDQEPL